MRALLLGSCFVAAAFSACVGGSPDGGSASSLPDGSVSSSSGEASSGGESSSSGGASSGGASSSGGTTTLSIRVIDEVGLASVGCAVTITGADGSVQNAVTTADGSVQVPAPPTPYSLLVRRNGSSATHSFEQINRLDPTARLYGEQEVLPRSATLSISVPGSITSVTAGVVGVDPLSLAGAVVTSNASGQITADVWSRANNGNATVGMLLFGGDAGTLVSSAVIDSAPLAIGTEPAYSNGAPVLVAESLSAGLAGITTTVPAGFRRAFVAAKLPLGPGLAPAYAMRVHRSGAGNGVPAADAFTAFGFPSGTDRKVVVEALAAADVFVITGRGAVAFPPFSYRRLAAVGAGDIKTVALPNVASLALLDGADSGVALAPGFAIVAPVGVGSERFVSVLSVVPTAPESNAPSILIHTTEATVRLPAAALQAGTSYTASVLTVGPFVNIDDYLAANIRLPPELADFSSAFARKGIEGAIVKTATRDDGDLAFATSAPLRFSTAP